MIYLVYVITARKGGHPYRRTLKRFNTVSVAETYEKQYMKRTGKFCDIRAIEEPFEYLKTSPTRSMPWIAKGLRCNMDGKDGVVYGDAGDAISILFDGEKHPTRCHPHWAMTYYNEDGSVLKDYKEKAAEV